MEYPIPQEESPSSEARTATVTDEQQPRVWRACLECRKRKTDASRVETGTENAYILKVMITHPGVVSQFFLPFNPFIRFLAHSSNTICRLAARFEMRCQQMEGLYHKMETLVGKLGDNVETLNATTSRVESQSLQDPMRATSTSIGPDFGTQYQFSEQFLDNFMFQSGNSQPDLFTGFAIESGANASPNVNREENEDDEQETEDGEDDESDAPGNLGKSVVDHFMTTDSYGKLRQVKFVGGTSNMVIVEALKSLSPPSVIASSPGESQASKESSTVLELPFFTRGLTWPRLPGLAKPEQLACPPRYISDLLINIYFDQLHYTMPVIYKPHFLQRYRLLLNSRTAASIDAGFLSVFFAVCACASGLLPREPGQSTVFTGLKYYENAISLHYASTGEGSIEQVQCLALQAGILLLKAGSLLVKLYAQRKILASMYFHVARMQRMNMLIITRGHLLEVPVKCSKKNFADVFGGVVLSNCLGRPMGVEDGDCDCEMPLDLEDGDLDIYCKASSQASPGVQKVSRLTGFIVFSKLTKISGNISRSMTSLMLQQKNKNSRKVKMLRKLVVKLEGELSGWLKQVPDVIKFSVNNVDHASPHLTIPLIPDGYSDQNSLSKNPSYLQTRNLSCSNMEMEADIEKSIQYLADLESVWAGAQRSKLMLEELLKVAKRLQRQKRPYADLESFNVSGPMATGDHFSSFSQVQSTIARNTQNMAYLY
ncbi:uncharacterized protein PAC_15515 [Phialocephala subalpina]|uniref:Transcription factor domain-containing protein n=1 Tax=Phialocephala subalpina TaxID=576137 RepID=A0A1L7XKM7_9HELO|nr:uncharacterized protein PAC_15515 [Phialocephala subalpina]